VPTAHLFVPSMSELQRNGRRNFRSIKRRLLMTDTAERPNVQTFTILKVSTQCPFVLIVGLQIGWRQALKNEHDEAT
jgi:hypothetical protein